ncbi:MAG: class II poly(R)-hydroxyalkanoic acid synthase [Acidimicrobiales bacterium]
MSAITRDDVPSDAIRGANPFVGLTPRQVLAAGVRFAAASARRPTVIASEVADLTAERLRILAGVGTTEIGNDKRFADAAWKRPGWNRLALLYLAGAHSLDRLVDTVGLDNKSAARAHFAMMQVSAALSPTNTILGNPSVLRRAAATRGRSLFDGGRNFVRDVRHNGGMPEQVDRRPFVLGENLACTPGQVVHRTELFELIQYNPTTAKVGRRPMVIVPPQVNKYYFLDLAPGRSFVEHSVGEGIQTFMISWRNPTPEQRDWSIETYLLGVKEAFEVVCSITGSDDVNTTAFCSGGMTLLMLLAHLSQTGSSLVNSVTLGVTGVDTEVESTVNMFVSKRTVEASISRSRKKGVLEGRSLASVFAWVRPNDLVWNYVVNNYLLGLDPPVFDVLAWNSDSTNLPATFHAEFTHLMVDNGLRRPGLITALGTPVDLSTVKNDMYVVGAMTDHLVPWTSTYVATQVTSGEHRFVLSNSGHIQALVNPPGNPKASYLVADELPEDPNLWLAAAHKEQGSWWSDWSVWALERSGELRNAPRALGNKHFRPVEAAPGRYVYQS